MGPTCRSCSQPLQALPGTNRLGTRWVCRNGRCWKLNQIQRLHIPASAQSSRNQAKIDTYLGMFGKEKA